jgi:hypothetical protein
MPIPFGTLLLGLAMLAIVGAIIVLPLLDRKTPFRQPLSQRQILEAERKSVIRSIRELDFDYETHKLSEDGYRQLRAEAVQRGAQILRQLEQLNERDIDAEIEQRVAAIRQRQREKANQDHAS